MSRTAGSGKTYTMEGSEEDPGINTRALQQLFALKETKEASALVEVKARPPSHASTQPLSGLNLHTCG